MYDISTFFTVLNFEIFDNLFACHMFDVKSCMLYV